MHMRIRQRNPWGVPRRALGNVSATCLFNFKLFQNEAYFKDGTSSIHGLLLYSNLFFAPSTIHIHFYTLKKILSTHHSWPLWWTFYLCFSVFISSPPTTSTEPVVLVWYISYSWHHSTPDTRAHIWKVANACLYWVLKNREAICTSVNFLSF